MDFDVKMMANLLNTQDNRATANPMFCVQEKVRDYGFTSDYAEGFVNLGEDCEIVDEEDVGEYDGDIRRVGYKDRWETIRVFFTEVACKFYMRQMKHRHGPMRSYVESYERCWEMIDIRKWLMDGADRKRIAELEAAETTARMDAKSHKLQLDSAVKRIAEMEALIAKALRHVESPCGACKQCDKSCLGAMHKRILRGEKVHECDCCGMGIDEVSEHNNCPECEQAIYGRAQTGTESADQLETATDEG